ncbi:hypothetical protein CB0940_00533 [Cercospora beticola]|uniref:Uncharacterized protein n=1 Tax=Cercospora beticola TaxID=122368 RepID=A0A2G5IBW1_CERBT|nr:hypothetical protein CB0940_00533 [Cercospora beticola]PIB02202.1 hypothetical protein CB0940_00533 [Cercospora beticola]
MKRRVRWGGGVRTRISAACPPLAILQKCLQGRTRCKLQVSDGNSWVRVSEETYADEGARMRL